MISFFLQILNNFLVENFCVLLKIFLVQPSFVFPKHFLSIFSCDEQLKKRHCHSVHPCVDVFVRSYLFFLVSRMFQGSFKGAYRKFQRCFKEFQECCTDVSGKCQGCLKTVLRKMVVECFKEDRRVFQGRFKSVSKKFQGYLRKFPGCINED